MAELSTKSRNDPARASANATPEERARIRAAIKRRFPNIGQGRAALIESRVLHP